MCTNSMCIAEGKQGWNHFFVIEGIHVNGKVHVAHERIVRPLITLLDQFTSDGQHHHGLLNYAWYFSILFLELDD